MPADTVHILCVENDDDSCDLLKALFESADPRFRLTTVQNAEDALSRLKRESFSLLILDHWLPQKSGIELCREIRGFDAKTPVLFFTADAREAEREKMLRAGANKVLLKVIDLDKLVSTARDLVNENR